MRYVGKGSVAGVMPLANGGKQGAARFEYKISMTQNKTYKISSSNQYAGYSFCITMYEDGKSNYIIGNLPFYRYDTCKIQSLKSSEKINFYKRVESDKWAYYVKLDDNANCIMTVNMSSVIDVVETTEDISSMTQIIPSIDNFGYNSLAELAGGVADVIKPIMPLGSITGNIDEIVDCGAYMCEPSLTTSSFELPFEGDFSLYTFASSNLAYFKFQIAVDMSQNNSLNVKFRRFRSSWTQWKSVSFV